MYCIYVMCTNAQTHTHTLCSLRRVMRLCCCVGVCIYYNTFYNYIWFWLPSSWFVRMYKKVRVCVCVFDWWKLCSQWAVFKLVFCYCVCVCLCVSVYILWLLSLPYPPKLVKLTHRTKRTRQILLRKSLREIYCTLRFQCIWRNIPKNGICFVCLFNVKPYT